MRETISSVGDEQTSGGTDRQLVLAPLGYIKRYPHIYSGLGAHQMYEQHWC